MTRIKWSARRAIAKKTRTWGQAYPSPEGGDEQLHADAARWARGEVDDTFDIAVERTVAPFIALSVVIVFACATAVANASGSPSTVLTVLTIVAGVVAGCFNLQRSSKKLRAEVWNRLLGGAVSEVQRRRAFQTPAPAARPMGVDWREAEQLAIEWMQHLGDVDHTATRAGADGGVDGISSRFVIQVKKREVDLVGVEFVRALHGVAMARSRRGVFFTTGRYTAAALDVARSVDMPLMIMRPQEGQLVGANPFGQFLRTNGVHVTIGRGSQNPRTELAR